MKIKVLFFGNLSEKTGISNWEVMDIDSLEACRTHIGTQFPALKEQVYLTAVNQDLIRGDHPLQDGDEIAIMPPFAGG